VIGTSIAIDASVFAATVGIDAGFKTNVRAIVGGDDGPGFVFEKLVGRGRGLFRGRIRVRFIRKPLESIGGIAARSSAMDR